MIGGGEGNLMGRKYINNKKQNHYPIQDTMKSIVIN